nr:hypothetical protein [Micrococcus endophyticus]
MQFRSVEQVTEDLAAAGLAVDRVWSDWRGRPFDGAEHPLMIIEACPQGARPVHPPWQDDAGHT